MKENKDKRAKFMKVFANLPESLRSDVVVVINGSPFTWNSAMLEIKNNSKTGKKIIKTLEKLGVI